MGKKTEDLILITKMGLDVELSKLRRIQDAMDALCVDIESISLSAQRRLEGLKVQGKADLSLVTGADEKWRKWQQGQISQINIKLAALRAERDIQTAAAKIAFGKNQVIQAIAKKMS